MVITFLDDYRLSTKRVRIVPVLAHASSIPVVVWLDDVTDEFVLFSLPMWIGILVACQHKMLM